MERKTSALSPTSQLLLNRTAGLDFFPLHNKVKNLMALLQFFMQIVMSFIRRST